MESGLKTYLFLWEYGQVKTTVELSDTLFRQAKAFAAARGMTLKQLFAEALQERLRRSALELRGGETSPPWMAGFGVLADLSDENRHVLSLIEHEFERLSSEDLV